MKNINRLSIQKTVNTIMLLLITIVILIICFSAVIHGIVFVRSFVDDNAYHIPIAVEIARHHNPYYVDTNSAFTSFWFPAGAEAFVAIFLLLSNDINTSNWSGSIFFLLFLVTTYLFAGIWTNDISARLLCVILCGIIPIFLGQTFAFYVDIHINFLIYLSLYLYALSITKNKSSYAYIGIGTSILTASIKYHGLIFCTILVPAGIFCILNCKNRRPSTITILFLISCISFTSGWYLRNLLLKGNPIYPLSLPSSFQNVLYLLGFQYDGIDFPNFSPSTKFPHPIIPKSIFYYDISPHMTDDAYGLAFPVSLTMFLTAMIFTAKNSNQQRKTLWFISTVSALIIIALPFHLTVPRYVMFLPAVTALWPSIILSNRIKKTGLFYLVHVLVLCLGITFIYANIIGIEGSKTTTRDALTILREGKNSAIVQFDVVEQGNLRIGYLNGRFGFIAALYDRRFTNQLIQLHYQDYLLDHREPFSSPDEFVAYVRSLDLDYIFIFDPKAPGAEILLNNFPEKTIVQE